MKITIWRGKDKSKASGVAHKTPVMEMKGVPVASLFPQATRSSGAEAVVIITGGQIRSGSSPGRRDGFVSLATR